MGAMSALLARFLSRDRCTLSRRRTFPQPDLSWESNGHAGVAKLADAADLSET